MGEGGIKNGQKNSDAFYGRPPTLPTVLQWYVPNDKRVPNYVGQHAL